MTKREKTAAVLVLSGLFLTATDSLITAAAAVALVAAGVALANWPEIRAKLRKIGSHRPGGAQYIARQSKFDAGQKRRGEFPAAVSRRTKKPRPGWHPDEAIEKRHNISITEKNRKVKVIGHPFDGID